MIRKITLSFTKYFFLFSFLFIAKSNLHAQAPIIVPQQLEAGLDRFCAGASFNEYKATFTYLDFPAGTTFQIEFSDPSGSFTQNTMIAREISVSDPGATQKTIRFAVPEELIGSDTYSMRVKSSTGVVSQRIKNSVGETSFGVFFKSYEGAFYINNKNTEATICAGSSMTLTVFNETPNVKTSSPANYPNLKYKWFKDNVLIAGQTGLSLIINAPGEYYSQIEYGVCTEPNTSSNRVNVVSSGSGSAAVINSSLGNPFCANGSGTVLTATSGNSYVWKRNGQAIPGSTRSITANESGLYTVDVDFGGCIATGSIDLKSNGFNASIDVPVSPEINRIEEGETLNVSVTTDATSPTFEWYFNGTLINGATTNSYLVAVTGNYKVKISQSSGCLASTEFEFRVSGPSAPSTVIPNIIKLSGLNPYWNIPNEYKNTNTKVMIISSNGDMVLDVVDYQGDWPQTSIDFKNVNPVYYYVIKGDAGEKKGSITVIK